MVTGYQIFLMIELGRINKMIPMDQEYDVTWTQASELYSEFEKSKFNLITDPEYDAIENFLKWKTREICNKELDLNIVALQASYDGDMKLSNDLWKLIESQSYRRLDLTMSLNEMLQLRKLRNK